MTTSKTEEALEAAGPATIEGVFALLRDVFRGGLAGAIAGVICLGVGSRVVMRVAALLDPDQHGRLTDNGNVIGAITFEGTLELVIFVGIFGGLATCAVWVLVRDWLPGELAPRMLLAGVIAAATGSFMVVDRENIDFALLEPTAANVAMFIGIVGLTGALGALFDRLLDAQLPAGDAASAIWGGLAALGGLPAILLLATVYVATGENEVHSPPRLAGAFLLVAAVATCVGWSRYFGRGSLRWLRPAGVTAVAGAALFGALDLAGEVSAIL